MERMWTMTTLATDKMKVLARQWEAVYRSAVLSGIVGDAAHMRRGGYHVSLEDQPGKGPRNYSAVRLDDAAPPGDWSREHSTALDESMSPADMRLCTLRLIAIYNDKEDPRRQYINAFNGWLGSGDAKRYDIVSGTVIWASPDHKSHVHLSIRRRYWNDSSAYDAVYSAISGETKAQYIARVRGVKPPLPSVHAPGTRDLRIATPRMTGVDVRFVQRWVRGSALNRIKDDGVYGPLTGVRVAWWQRQRGRTGTGVVARADWRDMGIRVKY